MLAGNNEDWLDKDTFVWFLPAQPGKYGRVCYGFETAHPQGGMNERGLFFDWFASGGQTAPQPQGKQAYPGDLGDALLEQCATVGEALALYERYHDANLGYATMLLAGAAGDMATVGWDWQAGRMQVTRGAACMAIGVGAGRLAQSLPSTPVTTKDFAYQLLLSSSDQTLYSTVSNLKTGEITLYNLGQFDQSVSFRLSDELLRGRHIYRIPALFPGQSRHTGDELTPWKLRGPALSAVCIAVFAVFVLAGGFCALQWARRPRGIARALPASGLLANAALVGLLAALNDKLLFVSKYGMALYGLWLPLVFWLAAALAVAYAAAMVIVWIKRPYRLAARLAATANSALMLAVLIYLATVGAFLS